MSPEQPSSEDLDFDDYFVDEERIQVAEEMIDGTTSIPVRHWMLDKLLEWIKIIFKRFGNSLHPDTPGVIKVSDVTAVFRLLQLMENILVTTDNEKPWIEEILWDKFCKLEEKALYGIKLTHIAILVMRQVNLARPLIKF